MKTDRRWPGTPTLAAGGIVLQTGESPRIAVVRLRKRSEWVLPKGKLDEGETARQAAEREVLEETGHAVVVHEFLGTLAYVSSAGSKAVHFWRMEAEPAASRALMDDVKEVDWLPLHAALERLSRSHERVFLAEVGPLALQAAGRAVEPDSAPLPEPSRRLDQLQPAPSAWRRLWCWLRDRYRRD
jgi:8-oxo-dGTP diphosphatase